MKILISGYYGFGNAGDELILEMIIADIRSKDREAELIVLSATPAETSKNLGLKAVNRWNCFKVINSIRRCDMLISGGGGLFQDATGSFGLYYYLGIILLGKLFGKKVVVYAAGVNELKTSINRFLTVWIFRLVDGITVREWDSHNLLVRWGLPKEKIIVTADPVMLKEVVNGRPPNSKPSIVFILRPQKGRAAVEIFAKLADSLQQRLNSNIVFIPFHPEHDIEFSLAVMNEMKVKPTLVQWKRFGDIYDTLGAADLIISQRLHGLILAVLYGIPLIGISQDPKIDRFLKELGQKNISVITDQNFYSVLAVVLDMWEWRDEFKKNAKKLLPDFKLRARKNSELPFPG